jgi:hypothetical protein
MSSPTPAVSNGRHILVADEDPAVVAFVIQTLRDDGRSTPEIEAQLPEDVPILREPFTAEQLLTEASELLEGAGRPHAKN